MMMARRALPLDEDGIGPRQEIRESIATANATALVGYRRKVAAAARGLGVSGFQLGPVPNRAYTEVVGSAARLPARRAHAQAKRLDRISQWQRKGSHGARCAEIGNRKPIWPRVHF